MTDTKRPNYFTSQFLVERDFNDEQAYHLTFRRRHNRVSHTNGVADGFGVTAVTGAQTPTVQIQAGTAIDKDGNEIVLNDAVTYPLSTTTGTNVYVSVKYQDVLLDSDKYTPAPEHFTRTTERPLLQDAATFPTDPSVIVLALIHLNGSAIQSIDTTARTLSSAKLPPGVVTATQLAAGAVLTANIGDAQTTGAKIATGTVTGGVPGTPASTGNIAQATITGGVSGNIATGTITGGVPGTAASTGNIAKNTITGGATGNVALGTITGGTSGGTATGNIAVSTITGAAAGSAATIGNIALGTISGGTSGGTGGASGGTAAGNIAIGTITGGAAGSVATIGNIAKNTITGGATGNLALGTITGTVAGTSTANGNIALGTITGGNDANGPTGNIALGTITGGSNGTNATGNIALGTIVGGNVAANTLAVSNLNLLPVGGAGVFVITGGEIGLPAGQSRDSNIVTDLGATQAVVLFSLTPKTTNGQLTWVEKAILTASNQRNRVIRVSNTGSVACDYDWRAVVLPI